MQTNCPEPLKGLRDEIVRLLTPERIILFNRKQNEQGGLTAVKLCVIIPSGDAREAERRLYMALDAEMPFDILVYTREEWERLLATPLSFAGRIRQTGSVLYEAD